MLPDPELFSLCFVAAGAGVGGEQPGGGAAPGPRHLCGQAGGPAPQDQGPLGGDLVQCSSGWRLMLFESCTSTYTPLPPAKRINLYLCIQCVYMKLIPVADF
jgi:hypothetical protein